MGERFELDGLEVESIFELSDAGDAFFAPDGDLIVCRGEPGQAEVIRLDASGGGRRWTLKERLDRAYLLVPLGERFAVACEPERDDSDVEEGPTLIAFYEDDRATGQTFEVDSFGAMVGDAATGSLYIGTTEGDVLVSRDGAEPSRLVQASDGIAAMTLSFDGRWLGFCDWSDAAWLLPTDGRGKLHRIGDGEDVTGLGFGPAGQGALAEGAILRSYDMARQRVGEAFDKRGMVTGDDDIATLCFSNDGELLLSGTLGYGRVHLWNAVERYLLGEVLVHPDHILRVAFDTTGERFLACSEGLFRVFRLGR
ncbi:MAG TPA: hypothetical protein VGB13_12920 [Candidatus Krumholzibacteria bacterium]